MPQGLELVDTHIEVVRAVDSHDVELDVKSGQHTITLSFPHNEHLVLRSYVDWKLSEVSLARTQNRWRELGLEPVDDAELRLYYQREVNAAELACFASHYTLWQRVVAEQLPYAVILEDDVCPLPFLPKACHLYQQRWRYVWERLVHQEQDLRVPWDLIYLGRNRFGADGARHTADLVTAGLSTCAHAYAISQRGALKLLAMRLHEIAMPVDDLLPALYATHPREDLARLGSQLVARAAAGALDVPFCALAFELDLVWQLESLVPGAQDDTLCAVDGITGNRGDGGEGGLGGGVPYPAAAVEHANGRPAAPPFSELCASDIRVSPPLGSLSARTSRATAAPNLRPGVAPSQGGALGGCVEGDMCDLAEAASSFWKRYASASVCQPQGPGDNKHGSRHAAPPADLAPSVWISVCQLLTTRDIVALRCTSRLLYHMLRVHPHPLSATCPCTADSMSSQNLPQWLRGPI
ncbi:hypothetical protein CYMTET_21266 [Cymbomonas tetramitiformis]|uniref:Glycosyl transferase family 25 domain-containing protein n=1 Tax=Cymbomonas tetramitiformis TaxID=36881 RepID=A0AAE0L349_9CHLO|nr:hypothetical protein CYMTET_21266 [Cymbomonas tetramitiformis]